MIGFVEGTKVLVGLPNSLFSCVSCLISFLHSKYSLIINFKAHLSLSIKLVKLD